MATIPLRLTLPAFVTIAVYAFLSSQIYFLLHHSLVKSNLFNVAEALGAIAFGCLSDKFCRRRTVLFSHIFGLCLFPLVLFFHESYFFIVLLYAFLFNPLPILRAGLIDNLPHISKIKIISFSFVAQYLPWAFYKDFFQIELKEVFYLTPLLLLLSLISLFFFFYDKRDSRPKKLITSLFHLGGSDKFLFTFLAAIPAQVVYFFSENLLAPYAENAKFYSILSFGSLVGACISSMYKKTPHISILTICYGLNVLLAVIPFAAIYLYHYGEISLPLMFIIFGCIGGFCIPFIYDVTMSNINVNARGMFCGVLDAVFSISSLINLLLVEFFNINLFFTLLMIPIFYAISATLQKKAE